MKAKKQILFFLFYIMLTYLLFSQEYAIETIRNGDRGLSEQCYFDDFIQDSSGNYWITGVDGIVKYDGNQSHFFPITTYDNSGFHGITCFNDSTFFIIKNNFLFHFHYKSDNKYVVSQLFEEKISKDDFIIDVFPQKYSLIVVTQFQTFEIKPNGDLIKNIYKSNKHHFRLALQNNDIILINDIDSNILRIKNNKLDTLKHNLAEIYDIFYWKDTYFAYDDNKSKLNSFYIIENEIKIKNSISTPPINFSYSKIVALSENLFAIASYTKGILIFKNKNQYQWQNKKNGLLSNSISFINYSQPVLYIGSQNGLSIIKNPLVMNFTEKQSLYDEFIWDITKFKNKIYLGTTSGLQVLEKIHDLKFKITNFTKLKNIPIYALITQSDKYLWIVTEENGGLYRFDGNSIIHYKNKLPEDMFFITNGCVNPENNLMLWGSETYVFKNNEFIKPPFPDSIRTNINSIKTVSDTLSLIISSKNLIYYNCLQQKIIKNKKTLNLRDVHIINKDSLIFYYTSGKVVLYDGNNEKLLTNKICGKNAYNMEYISKIKKMLITTEEGVHFWDLKTDSVLHINALNGLCYNETNEGALYEDFDGIWIGTPRGANLIPFQHIPLIKEYKIPYHLKIDFYGNNKNYPLQTFDTKDNLPQIPNTYNNVKLKFVSHSLLDAGKIYSDFKFSKWDTTISTKTEEMEFHYTNLPADDYIFNLKTYWKSPLITIMNKELKFEILPPFYQTSWFISIMIIIFVLIVHNIIRYRSRKLEHLNKRLNELVKKQTEKLDTYKSILENVFHNIKDPIAVFEKNGKLLLSNEAANELYSDSIYKLLENFPDEFKEKLLNIIEQQKIESLFSVKPIIINDLKYIFFFNSIIVKEKLRGYSILLIEVTNLLENQELKTRFKTLNQTFATFSHFINNYLQIISLHLDLYKMSPASFKLDSATKDMASSVKKINQMLIDFETSIQTGKIKTAEYAGIEDAIFSFKDQEDQLKQ